MEIFSQPTLQKYARSGTAGTVIMTEGDRAEDLCILIEGNLDIIKGGKKIHEINRPGAFFGELSFLLGTVRSASVVVASEEARYLCMPKNEVEAIWQDLPFARPLAEDLARRLHNTTSVAQGFREFCDSMPDAVIMTNADCEVISWNQAAEKLYGRTWHQMQGKSIEEIYDNQASFKQFMAELSDQHSLKEKSLKINHPEKDWFFVSTSTTVLKDPNGHVQGYLFIGRDATSLKQLERKQRRLKNWLAPALAVLAICMGWLGWQKTSAPPQWTYIDPKNPSCEHIVARLNRDTSTLQLALRDALDTGNSPLAARVLTDYFTGFHPQYSGINGVIAINGNGGILANYFPTAGKPSALSGEDYSGSRFSGGLFDGERSMEIFLVSRPEAVGGSGVEVTVNLPDRPGRIAYRLDMELIKRKYGCDINGLAGVINP